MFRYLVFAAFLAAPHSALALDLDVLSGQTKREACLAYVWIDIHARHETGAMSDRAFDNEKTRLNHKVYRARGSAFSSGATSSRLNQMIDTIIAEEPTYGQLSSQSNICRNFLRL